MKATVLNDSGQSGQSASGSATSGELVLTNPGGTNSIVAYQYPLTINGNDNKHSSYLVFYAVEAMGAGGLSNSALEQRSSSAISGSFKENTLAVVQMYMPNLVENINHNYDQNDGGFVQDLMMNMQGAISGNGDWDGMKVAGAAGSTIANHVSVAVGKAAQQYNAQISGAVIGDRSAQMYRSTGVRQQNFMFQLRPRSLAELREVGNILKTFLIYSSAENLGSASFADMGLGDTGSTENGYIKIKVPPLWFVEERINKITGSNRNRYTPKFAMGPAAITSVRINKTPEQLYQTFKGTAADSVAIDLEITLTELRPVFKDYWETLCKTMGGPDNGQFFFGSYSNT